MKFVFYPAQSGKPWNGATLATEPLGGSETAVAAMARELAKLGHEVIVFSMGEPGLYDDVVYLPFEMARTFLMTWPCDVLVCSRDAMPLLWSTRAAVKVFWAHDLPQGPLPDGFDLYFFVSNWQAQVYASNKLVTPEKVRVSPNGIDRAYFPSSMLTSRTFRSYTREDKISLAWTSNPERGLWHAARIFQRIRQTYPNAELHVFGRSSIYGWDMAAESNFHPDSGDRENVILHPALSKQELAAELARADLLLYPTWWSETFCISALEAQAAGCVVVSNTLGALQETVQGGVLVSGTPGVDADFDGFCAQAAVMLLEDGTMRKELAEKGRAFAEQLWWDQLASQWDNVLVRFWD